MRTKRNLKTAATVKEGQRVWPTMKAAAGALGISIEILKRAKNSGSEAFRSDGRVDERLLNEWLTSHQDEIQGAQPVDMNGAKLAEMMEKIRERKRKNDVAEGKLVGRSWVIERIHRMGGELSALQARSEAEHPLRMAAAGTDVPMNRTVLRGVWDEIRAALQGLAKHLEEQ